MEPAPLHDHATCCHQVASQDSNVTPFIDDQNSDNHRLQLAVEGMHCVRCVRAIESALEDEEGIIAARVNMSTARLVIEWQGDTSRADDYVRIVEGLGYRLSPIESKTTNEQSEEKRLLRSVAVAGFGMGNIMLLSVALWASDQVIMGMAMRDLFHWFSAIIALPVIAYAGRPFFSSAWAVLKHRRTNMDVPISLALLLACAMSLYETITHGEHAYFDSSVMLLFFLLIGRWLDARARGKAREGAQALLERMQGTALVLEGGKTRHVKMSDLRTGMIVRIAAGEKVPADAEILTGTSEIDTSLLTGETMPQTANNGDTIYAGTINLLAPLTARVYKAGEDSMLADIVRLMEQAEQGRAHYVRLADKAAKLYTPVVHTLAAATFIGWMLIGQLAWQEALLIAITTLIITCPCALGLAVPVVQVLTTSRLMREGILLKSGDALERLATIDTVVFDKTGTLTESVPVLIESPDDPHAKQLAASLAVHSHHPLAQSLLAAYDGNTLELSDIKEIAGHGMQGTWQGKTLRLGRRSWCGDTSVSEGNRPELWLQVGDGAPSVFRFDMPLKQDAQSLVAQFQKTGIRVTLLSGDHEGVVRHVAQELNIPDYQAGCLPADKTSYIASLKQQGHHVFMIGDGLNDAPALAAAHVALAPSTGIDMTQNTADIVLQNNRLQPIWHAWQIARFSTTLVKQNFALAVLYNCCAIPLAVAGYVTPLIAALAMSSSSLIVIANSFRINLKGRHT